MQGGRAESPGSTVIVWSCERVRSLAPILPAFHFHFLSRQLLHNTHSHPVPSNVHIGVLSLKSDGVGTSRTAIRAACFRRGFAAIDVSMGAGSVAAAIAVVSPNTIRSVFAAASGFRLSSKCP